MPQYHFCFLELCGVLECGTPESPDSDYGLCCVIEAATEEEALEWGYHIHGDFVRARTQFTGTPYCGDPIREGEIDYELDAGLLLVQYPWYARCKVGEYPNWTEPWKNCKADGVR